MEFSVLGALQVRDDAKRPAVLNGTLQNALLGVLLARVNQAVPVGVLADALWPGCPTERVVQRLQVHVHRLRALLGPDRLTFDAGGYQLRALPGELDVERFESLIDEASARPDDAADLLRTALGLWRGTPYAGMDVALLTDEAMRLTERWLIATESYYDAALRCGRYAEAVPELIELVREYPLRERLHGSLMIALHGSGRQADALAAYRQVRTTIVEELGLEPGPELRRLELQILTGADLASVGGRTAPAQLPHDVRGFVGRAAELAELTRLLDGAGDSAVISAIAGTAGVGKTALAIRWAHRTRDRFPDGQLYVDLQGYGPEQPMSTSDALAVFLRGLGLEGAAIPRDPAERAARYRTLLDRRRVLVVLDNARTADQVRPLLPGSSSCFVLVTSRDALLGLGAREGARRLTLDRLRPAEAHRLLGGLLGDRVRREPEAVAALIDRCARLPLALRIAVEQLGTRDTVADLVEELSDERHRLNLFDVAGDWHSSIRSVFSWSYHNLPPAAATVFRLLGRQPGHEVDVHTVATLAGMSVPTAKRAIGVLLHAHLVHETPDGRLQMHDLLRVYAAELAETAADRMLLGCAG